MTVRLAWGLLDEVFPDVVLAAVTGTFLLRALGMDPHQGRKKDANFNWNVDQQKRSQQ